MNDEHRPETKAEADRARATQFDRIADTVLGGVGFLANKPTRYLLTLMVVITFLMGGYSMYWLNNQNIESRRELQSLQKQMTEMREAYYAEIMKLRGEHYTFLANDHAKMVIVVEENTRSAKEAARVMFRLEQALDKLKL